jgi:predicted enzyme related to lactoylglutathione lyase
MESRIQTILYPVSDLARSKSLLQDVLGAEPVADAPYYVGFQIGDVHIGLDPNGEKRGMRGVTPFFATEDIRASIAQLVESGATLVEHAHEVGGGLIIAILSDMDGNMIGLSQQAAGS